MNKLITALIFLLPLSVFAQEMQHTKLYEGKKDANIVNAYPTVDRSDTAFILKAWDCELKVRLHNQYRCSTYMKDATTFEWEILLDEKPPTNVLTYEIESKNFDFFYQPKLTEQEIADGHSQPDSVVGSYAAYHSSKCNNFRYADRQENYGTGKAFHIYRPKVYDAHSKEAWCELDISHGELSVTVPQEFLNSAACPVVVDPTFGYTTKGAAHMLFNAAHKIEAGIYDAYTAASGDSILWAHACMRDQGGDDSVKIAFYTVSASKPVTKQDPPDEVWFPSPTIQEPTAPDWDSMTINFQLTASTEYCFAIGECVTEFVQVAYDIGSSGDSRHPSAAVTEFPANWPVIDVAATPKLSVYCTLNSVTPPTGEPNVLHGPSGAGKLGSPSDPSKLGYP